MVLNLISGLLNNCLYIISTFVLILLYFTYLRYLSYFSKQDVKYIRGWPLVGSMLDLFRGKSSFAELFQNFYNAFPNERFFGIYEMAGAPVYIIRDPELIKQITIKDFEHFVNHRSSVGESSDSLLSRSLFLMRDKRWREMRSTLSPAFTGSKMRLMLSLVNECAQKFSAHLLTESEGKPKVYDLKDLFTRFASDTIATSAFGLEVNSLRDRVNEFFTTGVAVTNFGGAQALKFFGYSSIPAVMDFFKVKFFSDDQTKFFRDLVHGNMSYREQNNIVRHDMINLLMEAKKGNLHHTSQDDTAEKDIGFATVQESEIGKTKKITGELIHIIKNGQGLQSSQTLQIGTMMISWHNA